MIQFGDAKPYSPKCLSRKEIKENGKRKENRVIIPKLLYC
jgi:hypothetical protein